MLEEAGLDALLNEALLLTTELSTNAVVHANTELDIEVGADPTGLTVTVTDFAPGPVEQLAIGPRNDTLDIGEVAERGRGLLLVDHFASRWGTRARGHRQGRLVPPGATRRRRPAARPRGSAPPRPAGQADGYAPSAGALTALLQVDPDGRTRTSAAPTSPPTCCPGWPG